MSKGGEASREKRGRDGEGGGQVKKKRVSSLGAAAARCSSDKWGKEKQAFHFPGLWSSIGRLRCCCKRRRRRREASSSSSSVSRPFPRCCLFFEIDLFLLLLPSFSPSPSFLIKKVATDGMKGGEGEKGGSLPIFYTHPRNKLEAIKHFCLLFLWKYWGPHTNLQ